MCTSPWRWGTFGGSLTWTLPTPTTSPGRKRMTCHLFLLGGAGKVVGLPLSSLGSLTPQGQGDMAIVKPGRGRMGLGQGCSRGC